MTLHKLLRRMSAVAYTMLEGTGRTDFEVDQRFLQKAGADIPFLWIVRKHGTGLYRLDEDSDRSNASFMLGHYVGSHTDFLIFHYDGKLFRQLFLSDALAELNRLFKQHRNREE